MSQYTIYTDGSYSSARDQGGVGIVVLRDGEKIQDFSKMYKNTTNNKMELTAVILALSAIKKPIDKLTIVTDSMYVLGCATKGWKRKKNQDLWKKFDEVYAKAKSLCKDINFEWTKGHEDDEWNNFCDKIAVQASQLL